MTTPFGTSGTWSADQYTYEVLAPSISGVSPNGGSTAGGTSVTISGSNFTAASTVYFGTVAATSFTVNSDGQITAVAPAQAAGVVDIRVADSAGVSQTGSSDQFSYVAPPPSITSVTPDSGWTSGGTMVALYGSNFTGATAVYFGTVEVTNFYVNSAGQITVMAPAHAAGTVDITVVTPGGTSSDSQDALVHLLQLGSNARPAGELVFSARKS